MIWAKIFPGLTNYPVQPWRSLVLTIQNAIRMCWFRPSAPSFEAQGYCAALDIMAGPRDDFAFRGLPYMTSSEKGKSRNAEKLQTNNMSGSYRREWTVRSVLNGPAVLYSHLPLEARAVVMEENGQSVHY